MNVRDETMAPARMVSFMEQHVANCNVCQKDPDSHDEVAKITEIILPESKIPKAIRSPQAEGEDLDEEEFEEDDSEQLDDDLDDDDLDDDLGDDDLDEEDLDEDLDDETDPLDTEEL